VGGKPHPTGGVRNTVSRQSIGNFVLHWQQHGQYRRATSSGRPPLADEKVLYEAARHFGALRARGEAIFASDFAAFCRGKAERLKPGSTIISGGSGVYSDSWARRLLLALGLHFRSADRTCRRRLLCCVPPACSLQDRSLPNRLPRATVGSTSTSSSCFCPLAAMRRGKFPTAQWR
jgi:hypothetical protein